MNRILELAGTALEGLAHIHQRHLAGHHLEETTSLFADVVHAFAQIEEAIHRSLLPIKETSDLTTKTDSLREGLQWMTAAYAGTSNVGPLATLQFTVLPRYKSWHEALQRVIRPHLAS